MRRPLCAVTVLAVLGSVAYAHDLFFKLDTYFLEPGADVRLPLLNGTFNTNESPLSRDRISDISLIAPQGRYHIDTVAWTARNDTSFLTIRTGSAGTYVVGVSTRPEDIELKASDVNQYLENEGMADVLAERRRDNQLGERAWERYSKHVKAVFQVGDVTTDEYAAVFGYPAEIIPVVNPYTLKRGEELRVRCLVDGDAVIDQLVVAGGLQPDGETIVERSARTDGRGVAGFSLDAEGKWYVKFVSMVSTDGDQPDYESKWATLTFEVKQE